ncbi:diaminopimelate epimerase [Enterococcus sp. LJL90]
MKLIKVHGSENDFFILDQTQFQQKLTDSQVNQLTQAITPREGGLVGGADGILLVDDAKNSLSLGQMRVINNDGSEASMCGNGLRTVARYLAEKNQQDSFNVETMFADLKVRKAPALGEKIETYQVEISPVSFDLAAVPANLEGGRVINQKIPELSDELLFSVVAVPNPHLITFVDETTLKGPLLEEIAQKVNGENNLFPDGVNVSFVQVLGQNEIFVRTFERGVGLTNACGTAMSASSLMHVLLNDGRFMQPINVKNPGGMVQTVVHENPDGGYWMELVGNATNTHLIEGELDDFMQQNFDKLTIVETDEQADYQKFLNNIEK